MLWIVLFVKGILEKLNMKVVNFTLEKQKSILENRNNNTNLYTASQKARYMNQYYLVLGVDEWFWNSDINVLRSRIL